MEPKWVKVIIASLLLHLLFASILFFGSLFSKEEKQKRMIVPKKRVVQAVAIDETLVKAEMDRQRRIEKDRLDKIAEEKKEIKRLQSERKMEQDRLKKLKNSDKQKSDKKRQAEKDRKKKEIAKNKLAAKKRAVEKKHRLEAEEKQRKIAAEKKRADEEIEQRRLKEEERVKEKKRQEEEERVKERERQEEEVKAELERQRLDEERKAEDERQRLEKERLREETERERIQKELQTKMAAEDERLQQEKLLQQEELMVQYIADISGKVERNWIRPQDVVSGSRCRVLVKQIPGGEIIDVSMLGCEGSTAFRNSVEKAVYRASPLPTPSDPELFEREIEFIFEPE